MTRGNLLLVEEGRRESVLAGSRLRHPRRRQRRRQHHRPANLYDNETSFITYATFREVDASQGAITDDPPAIKLRLVSARRKLADARSRRAPPPFLRDQEVAESPEDPDDKELVCMGVLMSIYIHK